MNGAQDQLVFVMTDGETCFVRSFPRGQGENALREFLEADSRWIQVDGSKWILRDHVLYMRLTQSDDGPVAGGV